MKKKSISSLNFVFMFILVFIFYPAPVRAQGTLPHGTWVKFETVTEKFEDFMRNNPLGNKYNSGMNAIRNVIVRSEAEAMLVSDSAGIILTYTEKTIFESSGFNSAIFRLAWGPMQSRYPIEMWRELRERTDDGIKKWIKGGDDTGVKHGDIDKDMIWIIEKGLAGAGGDTGWGLDISKKYDIGAGAVLSCSVDVSSRSYIMTITIPLEPKYFSINDNEGSLKANISFHDLFSSILKTSRLFRSDTFIMTKLGL